MVGVRARSSACAARTPLATRAANTTGPATVNTNGDAVALVKPMHRNKAGPSVPSEQRDRSYSCCPPRPRQHDRLGGEPPTRTRSLC